jgi:hypothetical protein
MAIGLGRVRVLGVYGDAVFVVSVTHCLQIDNTFFDLLLTIRYFHGWIFLLS